MTKLLSHNVASCRLSETFSSGAETWSLHVRGNPGPVFLTHVQRLTAERPPRCSEDVQIPGASSGSGAAGPSAGGSEQLAQEPVPTGWRCSARRGFQGAAERATWASLCTAGARLTPGPMGLRRPRPCLHMELSRVPPACGTRSCAASKAHLMPPRTHVAVGKVTCPLPGPVGSIFWRTVEEEQEEVDFEEIKSVLKQNMLFKPGRGG